MILKIVTENGTQDSYYMNMKALKSLNQDFQNVLE